MNISFRTRLFGMATLIVAVVLVVVLLLGWFGVLRYEIQRLEDRLCMEARRVATQPHLGLNPEALENDLRLRLRLPGPTGGMVLRLEPGTGAQPVRLGGLHDDTVLDLVSWRRVERLGPPPSHPPRPPRDEFPPGQYRGPPDRARGDAPPRYAPPGFDQSPPPSAQALPAGAPPPPRGNCELARFDEQGSEWRAARFTTPRSRALLGMSLDSTKGEMQSDVQRALWIVLPLALALTALGAWLLASLSLRPVNRLRAAMQGVTQQDLERRLDTRGEDREFQDLIGAYNTMLDRLAASFQQASRFSADAAHELKTPLTILQGRLEQALQQPTQHARQSDLSDMLDEVGRLSAITRKLLLLSQADAGQLRLNTDSVDLSELLDTLVADAQMLAPEQALTAQVPAGLRVPGDTLLLRQLFNNLLSNALRYGRPGGWIRVQAQRLPGEPGQAGQAGQPGLPGQKGMVDIVVANACAPLDATQRERFFNRFHRGDGAHNRAVDGHGLGLSLSREIARAHGGDLQLLPSAADEVRLGLRLPAGP